MTETQVVDLLRIRLEGKTQTALASDAGVTVQYMHDVLKGRRAPGPAILKFLGIAKRKEYVMVPSRAR